MMARDAFDPTKIALSGKNLVEASAGTGKTHTITTLLVRLLVESRLRPSEIAILTFTEAATSELRERVRVRLGAAEAAFRSCRDGQPTSDPVLEGLARSRRERLGSDISVLEAARDNVDEVAVSTIHGFCQRILRENTLGTRMVFDAELVPDLRDLRDDALYDFWHERVASGPKGLVRQLRELEFRLDRLRTLVDHAQQNPYLELVPAPLAVDAGELARTFSKAQRLYREFHLPSFIEENCAVSSIGDLGRRTTLYQKLDALFRRDEPWVPKHAELLFPECVAEALAAKRRKHPCPPMPGFFAAFRELAHSCWEQVIVFQHDLFRSLPIDLRARKELLGVIGFEDLLQRLQEGLASPAGADLARALGHQYRAILIDEFQDTDPTQVYIFGRLREATQTPLFLIGDPKQAIYGFRGADVFTYLNAADSANRHTMGTNWRSDPRLVQAINRVFRKENAFLIPEVQYRPVVAQEAARDALPGPNVPFELLFIERADPTKCVSKRKGVRDVAGLLAADVADLLRKKVILDRGPAPSELRESDIAVLTRTNDQCFLVQDALTRLGVRSVVIGDKSVFSSDEALELELVLGAVLDPTSGFDLKRALASHILGVSGDEIARIEVDPAAWYDWSDRFRRLGTLWVERGFMRMFLALLDETNARVHLLHLSGGERSLTNVLHLGELLSRAATERHLGPAALLAHLRALRSERGVPAEHAEIRLESDEDAVRILTIHKSKGLEFPVVYCPYLWAASGTGPSGLCLFHDERRKARLDVDLNEARREPNRELARRESLAEELRVVYVALTRAKHRVSVFWGNFRDVGGAAAAQLFHPEPLVQTFDAQRLSKRSDMELLSELEGLSASSEGAIGIRKVPASLRGVPYQPIRKSRGELRAREVSQAVRARQRTDSFSSLVRHDTGAFPEHEDERDHDQDALRDELSERTPVVEPLASPAERESILLDGFPRGARTGDFFHEILEEIDFNSVDPDALRSLVARKLNAFGLLADADDELRQRWLDQSVATIESALDTPLAPGTKARLRDVPLAKRLSELEFRLPVALGALGEQDWLTARRLSSAFAEHRSEAVPRFYSERVAQLRFQSLRGFLKGYVDLVFEHEGKWFVVDYKSNHLGDFVDEYQGERVTLAMAHSHYFLQYHLYVLALDRYLRRFQPGYDYQVHFGGVLYLFLKGMRPESPGTGIFFEKPPLQRLQALSRAFGGEPP